MHYNTRFRVYWTSSDRNSPFCRNSVSNCSIVICFISPVILSLTVTTLSPVTHVIVIPRAAEPVVVEIDIRDPLSNSHAVVAKDITPGLIHSGNSS